MNTIDWLIAVAYLLGMLGIAFYLGREQSSKEDYFLGGKRLRPFSLATSTIATQSSTNSLLGIPAFVGFSAGGGLIWLQYEIAVPLAMLALVYLLRPVRRLGVISIYDFLEHRLGRGCRLLASANFLFFRAIATSVTLYGVALVLTLLLPVNFTGAVLVLMSITIAYDLMGGMRAVVISDVLQMIVLVGALIAGLVLLAGEVGGYGVFFSSRTEALVFDWGISGGNDYGLWPMLFGGFFLYVAYYGCDQSQAQRLLSARDERDLEKILLLSGTLRFPLVFVYCLLGLGLAAYARLDPGFITTLPTKADGTPNFNLAFPVFVLEKFSAGIVGLVIIGIFAAAMSSIDSALNSLSAVATEDFLSPRFGFDERSGMIVAKITTLGWGLLIVMFSFQVENIAPTVLEAINKIGSMVNGPLLSLFVIAVYWPGLGQRAAMVGFCSGLTSTLLLWLCAPSVSWLWWNAVGLCSALLAAVAVSGFYTAQRSDADRGTRPPTSCLRATVQADKITLFGLFAMAGLILTVCVTCSINAPLP